MKSTSLGVLLACLSSSSAIKFSEVTARPKGAGGILEPSDTLVTLGTKPRLGARSEDKQVASLEIVGNGLKMSLSKTFLCVCSGGHPRLFGEGEAEIRVKVDDVLLFGFNSSKDMFESFLNQKGCPPDGSIEDVENWIHRRDGISFSTKHTPKIYGVMIKEDISTETSEISEVQEEDSESTEEITHEPISSPNIDLDLFEVPAESATGANEIEKAEQIKVPEPVEDAGKKSIFTWKRKPNVETPKAAPASNPVRKLQSTEWSPWKWMKNLTTKLWYREDEEEEGTVDPAAVEKVEEMKESANNVVSDLPEPPKDTVEEPKISWERVTRVEIPKITSTNEPTSKSPSPEDDRKSPRKWEVTPGGGKQWSWHSKEVVEPAVEETVTQPAEPKEPSLKIENVEAAAEKAEEMKESANDAASDLPEPPKDNVKKSIFTWKRVSKAVTSKATSTNEPTSKSPSPEDDRKSPRKWEVTPGGGKQWSWHSKEVVEPAVEETVTQPAKPKEPSLKIENVEAAAEKVEEMKESANDAASDLPEPPKDNVKKPIFTWKRVLKAVAPKATSTNEPTSKSPSPEDDRKPPRKWVVTPGGGKKWNWQGEEERVDSTDSAADDSPVVGNGEITA